MIYDGVGVRRLTRGTYARKRQRNVRVCACCFGLPGNLCCDLWVCRAIPRRVLIVHLLCCMAMFVFDAISQAAASPGFKAWRCVRERGECHCVFVQSCGWTTVLSFAVLMPVPLPPAHPHSLIV